MQEHYEARFSATLTNSYHSGDEYTNVSTIMKGATDDNDPEPEDKQLPVVDHSQDDTAPMMLGCLSQSLN